ncbi:MAG: substrate-binding domain-containing protein [Burkholderiaceae bacterium]
MADPASNRLGDLLAHARGAQPPLRLELHHAMSGAALAGVQDSELDASFFFGDAPGPGFLAFKLRRLIYRVTAPAEWADRVDGAQWDEIRALPWIGTPITSTHASLVRSLFAQHGLPPPDAAVEADDESVLTNLVVSGLGVALVRDDVARRLERSGGAVIWTRTAIDTALWFVCLAKRSDEPAIAALLDAVRKTWKLDASAFDESIAATSA